MTPAGPQVLLALGWHTYLLSQVTSGRGTLLMLYVLILLFGVFQLRPRVFARCAAFALGSFIGLNQVLSPRSSEVGHSNGLVGPAHCGLAPLPSSLI